MYFHEKLFMLVTGLSLMFSMQMLIDIPAQDFPDIKDNSVLFPNLNQEA